MSEIGDFFYWATKDRQLSPEYHNRESLLAIAQHYGLPTTFIDFTRNPEIALFFSTDHAKEDGSRHCVFCTSTKEVRSGISSKIEFKGNRILLPARLVEIEVSNLWRLEAQEGVFIDVSLDTTCPLEDIIDLHLISFPGGSLSSERGLRNLVYPERKSSLEVKLDQYFHSAYVQDGLKQSQELGVFVQFHRWDDNSHAFESFELPDDHPTWDAPSIQPWTTSPVEHFRETLSPPTVCIPPPESDLGLDELPEFYSRFILGHSTSQNRAKPIEFQLDRAWSEEASINLVPISAYWDGVRGLPYSPKELARGFGALVSGMIASVREEGHYLESVLGETIEIECSVSEIVHFRTTVSCSGLVKALRTDFRSQLDVEAYPDLLEPIDIINHLHSTRKLFTFPAFRELMIAEMIPTQLVKKYDRTGYYGTSTAQDETFEGIYFNPFEVSHLRSATSWISYAQRYRTLDRSISLHPDLHHNELLALAWDARQRIESGERPATVTFSGFPDIERLEIYEIPAVVEFCKVLLDIGFVAVLEVATTIRDMEESYDPYSLGALEIWMLTKGLMGRELTDIECSDALSQFANLLSSFNHNLASQLAKVVSPTQEQIAYARLVGLLGRAEADKPGANAR